MIVSCTKSIKIFYSTLIKTSLEFHPQLQALALVLFCLKLCKWPLKKDFTLKITRQRKEK